MVRLKVQSANTKHFKLNCPLRKEGSLIKQYLSLQAPRPGYQMASMKELTLATLPEIVY